MLALMILSISISHYTDGDVWIYFLFSVFALIHFVSAVCIVSDLIRKDHIIIEGELVTKQKLYNGWKFRVRTASGEKLRKFRTNNHFDETLKKFEIDEPIAVTYFRLTRAVFAIQCPEIDEVNK